MNIVIEKGVPLPIRSTVGLSECLKALEVGDSFVLPDPSTRNSLSTYASRVGIKITVHKERDGSVRVWRIE